MITIPEVVFWTIVLTIAGAILGMARKLYSNTQRLDDLERSKVSTLDCAKDSSACRAAIVQRITEVKEEMSERIAEVKAETVGIGYTVDEIAVQLGVTPHPRPSNGKGRSKGKQ